MEPRGQPATVPCNPPLYGTAGRDISSSVVLNVVTKYLLSQGNRDSVHINAAVALRPVSLSLTLTHLIFSLDCETSCKKL